MCAGSLIDLNSESIFHCQNCINRNAYCALLQYGNINCGLLMKWTGSIKGIFVNGSEMFS